MKMLLPEGFTPPQNARPDEPFEVVATLRLTEDGQFSIVALDGVAMPEEDDEPVDERVDSAKVRLPFGEDDEEY